ncbi:hypothetical protein Tco_0194379, partial [Tanacetum coccineum]
SLITTSWKFPILILEILSKEIHLKMISTDPGQSSLDPEDQVKMEMEIPRSSGVNSQPHAHT